MIHNIIAMDAILVSIIYRMNNVSNSLKVENNGIHLIVFYIITMIIKENLLVYVVKRDIMLIMIACVINILIMLKIVNHIINCIMGL